MSEVREAVSGYRQPTLDGELAGARMALSAAGIRADVDRPAVTLDPEVEAVLAWTVREGATNVIRHSSASRCTMRIGAGLGETTVEVVDDGVGPAAQNGNAAGRDNSGGHGLAGLAERAAAPRGSLEADSLPEGGVQVARHGAELAGTGIPRGAVIRVLLAEDQAMVRGALASLLGLEPDIEVVAQVSRGDEVVGAAVGSRPDVALLDIEMPGSTGSRRPKSSVARCPSAES